MSPIQLVIILAQSLAGIASDPALGYRGAAVSAALKLAAAALVAGDDGYADLKALTDQVQAMVDAGREPTKDEWQALADQSAAAHEILNPTPKSEEPESGT